MINKVSNLQIFLHFLNQQSNLRQLVLGKKYEMKLIVSDYSHLSSEMFKIFLAGFKVSPWFQSLSFSGLQEILVPNCCRKLDP